MIGSSQIGESSQNRHYSGQRYDWHWSASDDVFILRDKRGNTIASGPLAPHLVLSAHQQRHVTRVHRITQHTHHTDGLDALSLTYHDDTLALTITLTWQFADGYLRLLPLQITSQQNYELVSVHYFARVQDDLSVKPLAYSRYVVSPGLCMNTNVSPIVDLHSKLSVTSCLGSGAMRGVGLTQQWGLPAHYFCTFNTDPRWNTMGGKHRVSDSACWGLASLPLGDFRLQMHDIAFSPILNVRSDLWSHQTLGQTEALVTGFDFVINIAENFHESIRCYYRQLIALGIIAPKQFSEKKLAVTLSAQYNTWGVEVAKGLPPEHLTADILNDIYQRYRDSGMQAGTFVVDDKWEGSYGELAHDTERFPDFVSQLNQFRADGHYVGLWAAFLRCQDPTKLGLTEQHLLQTHEGKTLWLAHGEARYGIFDVTQPAVKAVLTEKAKAFMARYQPDIIKFDFGYELPSMDVAAPFDKAYSGEKLLVVGLDIIVDAMKYVNPDLVVMYYGLSPLLIDYYDLHSPDDLVYCAEDYDLETNRRTYFSSVCGELGMPTYSSSGYEWVTSNAIWFDVVASGTVGSLHCFEGDENGDMPDDAIIAKYNGLAKIRRLSAHFSVYPLGARHKGGQRSGYAPSWMRQEAGKITLLALRPETDLSSLNLPFIQNRAMVVISSLDEEAIASSRHLGLVGFDTGSVVLTNTSSKASMTLHYFDGSSRTIEANGPAINIDFAVLSSESNTPLSWIEIVR